MSENKENILNQLLTYNQPKELIKSLNNTFYTYLLYQADKGIDNDYKQTVENHFMLVEFLEKLENLKD